MDNNQDYALFHKFIESFSPAGFKEINAADSLMMELENVMEKNNQFLYIADIIQMKVIFTSNRSIEMIGITQEEVSPYHFMEATHPDDIQRLNLGRAKSIKLGQELFITKEEFALLSLNLRMQNDTGGYSNLLNQIYLFYSSEHNTVFFS